MWTGFPFVFAAIASTLSIPLTLVSLGIIARGSVFAFRKVSTLVLRQRLFGATFALSSPADPVLPRHGGRRHRQRPGATGRRRRCCSPHSSRSRSVGYCSCRRCGGVRNVQSAEKAA